jgi:hypothetical protein
MTGHPRISHRFPGGGDFWERFLGQPPDSRDRFLGQPPDSRRLLVGASWREDFRDGKISGRKISGTSIDLRRVVGTSVMT